MTMLEASKTRIVLLSFVPILPYFSRGFTARGLLSTAFIRYACPESARGAS